ncbi:NAD-dependent epimerase/dehydratase family protein [Microbacterium sp. cx-59]|uniref:NAD-dependent epimerase/dehydratase family protein n=1 Tax=Microbacterium sp. cx-59 TaxID=2891207 RepID=UPI001E38B968|nr:NAD-dependent epimerase/dehydratase family protein [Microbacterium sp. cx-59]MCC4908092.1 GDP-mannose 4,6-dehydratase [Microbacterium sp. cx-59]
MTGQTLLITGANGFVGAHVAATAAAAGHTVWAVGRESEPTGALGPHISEYFSADLEHVWEFPTGPDAIVHLAGLAAVGPSFDNPQQYLNVNSGIMTRMSEALIRERSRARVVVVSSGSVYAPPVAQELITEDSPVVPSSPYAVAKILVETQAAYYAERGLDTVIARPFNHIGPGQGPGFLVPDLTAALQELNEGENLRVGNLAAARDYTDVRDVSRAYLTLAFAPGHKHHVYNVASGASHTGHAILETIADALERQLPTLEVDPSRFRPTDPAVITGSASRLSDEFGWAPTIPWQQSVREFATLTATAS